MVAGGVGLFFLLKGDEPTPVATSPTTQSTSETSSTEQTTEESTEETEETGDELVFDDSPDIAEDFLALMAAGDSPAAYGLLTESVQLD